MTINPPSAKPSPLGRGLSALFGDTDASYAPPKPVAVATPAAPVVTESKASPTSIAITWLQPGAFQPRRHFDEEALKFLASSIKERGILEPLVVRPIHGLKDHFEIIAGERRWRAAQIAGLHNVPVVVRNLTDREALEFGLIENVQRQDLSPLEEAEGYKRLLEEFSHSQEDLAKIVGKSRPHITNMLRILTLPAAVKQMIERGELTLGHARAIIPARDPVALATLIVKKGWNVRQAEAAAKREQDNPETHKRKEKHNKDVAFAIGVLEKDLERDIGLKVKVETMGGQSGAITFYYQDHDQFSMIVKKMSARG